MPLMGALLSLPQKCSKGRWHRDPQPTWVVTAFLQWRLNHAPSEERLRSLADVVRQHRYKHARILLETACQEAAQLTDYRPVLQRFLCQST
jgi:hypothetical protein